MNAAPGNGKLLAPKRELGYTSSKGLPWFKKQSGTLKKSPSPDKMSPLEGEAEGGAAAEHCPSKTRSNVQHQLPTAAAPACSYK